MSKRTPEVKIRKRDNAVICNAKVNRGRCNKLLVTSDGNLVCNNGHAVSLREAITAYIANSSKPTEAVQVLRPCPEAFVNIVKAMVSPMCLINWIDSTSLVWYKLYPDFYVWLIEQADQVDRQAGAVLRDYWEKDVAKYYEPLLGEYFKLLRQDDWGRYLVERERLLHSFSRWGRRDAQGFLARAEAMSYVAKQMGTSLSPLYEHNVKEATASLSEEIYKPIYFLSSIPTDRFTFTLLIDPMWKEPFWRQFSRRQVCFIYRADSNDIKWDFNCLPMANIRDTEAENEVIGRIHDLIKNCFSYRPCQCENEQVLLRGGGDNDDVIMCKGQNLNGYPLSILEVVKSLCNFLGGLGGVLY